MEFGVSPMPETRRAMIERGTLFGVPTYRWIPARTTLHVKLPGVCHRLRVDSRPAATKLLNPSEQRLVVAGRKPAQWRSRRLPAEFLLFIGVNGKRNNGVVYIARAIAQQPQFHAAVARISLPPEVVSLTARLGADWNGNDAVFFQIVLADNSVPRPQLLAFTKQISQTIVNQLNPNEEWGVWPYFDFITQSELARMNQPTWA